mmetsp:Transcript_35900/g.40827  ORF Transcript_35900/g.40827 Transcript_35900/m.40827 type:complete len:472 (-) Transcript_35900:124-1539(-)
MSFSDFFEQRDALLAENEKFKRSSSLNLTNEEKRAEEKFQGLIKKFSDSCPEFDLHKTSLMDFKPDVMASDLYKAVLQAPKGALHHLHNMTGLLMSDMIKDCVNEDNVWYNPEGEGVCRKSVRPEGYIKMSEFKATFDTEEKFNAHMINLFELDAATADSGDSKAIWNKFDSIFGRIFGFFNYVENYKKILRRQFQACLDDNIYRVELRHGFGLLFDDEDKPIDNDAEIKIFQEFEEEFKAKCPAFSIGVISIGFKAAPLEQTLEAFEECYRLRKKYPHIVMGFDLVQEENTNPETSHFIDIWRKSEEFQAKHGVDCPFYFHAGETESVGMKNVADSIILGSKRIGHGLSAAKFPHLVHQLKEKRMCVESCPLSNQVLGYVHDMRAHPCGIMFRMGVPISISNDDPGLFGYTGTTLDIIWAVLGWELTLRDVKQLCLDSIEFSTLEGEEKQKLHSYWEGQWNDYIVHLNSM